MAMTREDLIEILEACGIDPYDKETYGMIGCDHLTSRELADKIFDHPSFDLHCDGCTWCEE